VSFLEPDHEPLSRGKKILLGVILALGTLVIADGFKLINLHGFGLPLLMSVSIFASLNQHWERKRQQEQEDGNG
jgi:hypothetical protein